MCVCLFVLLENAKNGGSDVALIVPACVKAKDAKLNSKMLHLEQI